MAFPSLESALNKVSNRYLLVVLSAKRARQLNRGAPPRVDSKHKKPFELPVDALRAINANGSVIFDQAQMADAHMTDVRLRFQTAEVTQ